MPDSYKYEDGPGDYDELAKAEKKLYKYKWMMLVCFSFRMAIVIATFAICIWIRFDLDFRVWIKELEWYTYWYCMYVTMFAMLWEMAVCILGVWGVVADRTGFIKFAYISMFILVPIEATGGILMILYGIEESPLLIDQLTEVFLNLVYQIDVDERASWVLRQISEYVHCCGATGSEDFIRAYKPVPMECRDQVKGNEYRYGCKQTFAWWLEPWSCYLTGADWFLMFFGIFMGIICKKLRKLIFFVGPREDESVYSD